MMSFLNQALWAARFAVVAHQGQVRKGEAGLPYVVHCIDVADMVSRAGFRHEAYSVQAALLHDVLEDTPVTSDEIREKFGETVEDIVRALTLPPEARNGNREAKLAHQIEAVRDRGPNGRYVRAIKIADKTANVRSIIEEPPPWSRSTMLGYLDSASQVVGEAFCASTDARIETLYRDFWIPTYLEASELLEKIND